jgi:hypothetical protein
MMDTDKNSAMSFHLLPAGFFCFGQATSPVYCFMLIRNRMLIRACRLECLIVSYCSNLHGLKDTEMILSAEYKTVSLHFAKFL